MRSGPRLGVDIGGSKVLAVVLDDHDRPLGQARVATRPGSDAVVTATLRAVRGALARTGLDRSQLVAAGVGVPGVVEPGSGGSRYAVNLGLGSSVLDLAAALERELRLPVGVENDVNAAALGAFTVLRGRGHAADAQLGDLALISIGTGLAAGVVLDGRLHRGNRGAAGEIGHLPLDPLGLPCSCGQRGCLETVASGSALVRAWDIWDAARQYAGMDVVPVPDLDRRPSVRRDDVWAALAGGDARAGGVVTRFAHGVAAAVRVLVLAWDVERILLAGGVTRVGAPLLRAVQTELDTMSRSSTFIGSLDLARRVSLVPQRVPVAAIGAALAVPRSRAAASASMRSTATATGQVG